MKLVATVLLAFTVSGCAVVDRVREVWPRAHDPAMVQLWVNTNVALGHVNCDAKDTGWAAVADSSERLAQYTEFRKDPQAKNMRGLYDHSVKMAEPTTKPAFCKLGIKTAEARLTAARSAWEGR